jgi:hypothetical protein
MQIPENIAGAFGSADVLTATEPKPFAPVAADTRGGASVRVQKRMQRQKISRCKLEYNFG